MSIKYKRVILKISGEALAGENGFGFDFNTVDAICEQATDIIADGINMALHS